MTGAVAVLKDHETRGRGLFTELGVSGLSHSAGLVDEEFVRQLQGDRWVAVAKEMSENDDVVGATLTAMEMLVRQVEWRTEPVSDAGEDMEAADWLDGVKDDMSHPFEEMVSESLTMLPYGWDFREIVYKRRRGPSREPGQSSKFTDGKIGIRKIPTRSQDTRDRWLFDESGGVQGMVQRDPNSFKTIAIPIERALLFRASHSKGSPEGRSILRRAFRAWYFKKRIQQIEAIGVERDLAGLPKGYAPAEWFHADATAAEKAAFAALKSIGVNLRRDEQEFVLIPSVFDDNHNRLVDIELMTSGGQRQFDTNEIVRRYDRGIAGSMLADFILLGHDKVGSFALSSDKTDLFAVALGSVLDEIATVLNRHLVPRLFRLNGAPERMEFPTFVHGDIEKVDINMLAESIQKLTASGMPLFPNDAAQRYVMDLLGFPADAVDAVEQMPEDEPPAEIGDEPEPDDPDEEMAA